MKWIALSMGIWKLLSRYLSRLAVSLNDYDITIRGSLGAYLRH